MMTFLAILLGLLAILAAIGNVALALLGREAKWLRFASLSLTALALCAFFAMTVPEVHAGDWSALMDVIPPVSRALWVLTPASIAINSISLFLPAKRR